MSTLYFSPVLSHSAALPRLGTLQLGILLQEFPGQPQNQKGRGLPRNGVLSFDSGRRS